MSLQSMSKTPATKRFLSRLDARESVAWARAALHIASKSSGFNHDLFEEVHLLACDEARWADARSIFERLRVLRNGLEMDSPTEQTVEVAELVCKVAHNAAGMTPSFDPSCKEQLVDAGCRLAMSLGQADDDEIACVLLSRP